MRLVLYRRRDGGGVSPGLLTARGIVDIEAAVAAPAWAAPQAVMESLIERFEALRPALERLEAEGEAVAADTVRLLPPLPRPGKILCCIGNYWEHAEREPKPLNMFLKNSDAVIGPDDTVALPDFTEPWIFMHEAELALVIKGPVKAVPETEWRRAVFGYTCLIDVSARGEGRRTWRAGSWMGKSFDTFAPIGPCITTADEIPDPNNLHVRFWDDGQLRHDYNTDDMEHRVPALVAFATKIMTLGTGDLIACGTNHEGLGPMQDGERCEIEIERIGRMGVNVVDPLKRRWERGVYMGADSTNRAVAGTPERRR